jgi:nucleoside-diphosphate-sugar epimerase
MTISITGASGFVGTNLINYLKDDFKIESKNIRFVPNQLLEVQSNVVIHLAGKAHDLKKVSKPNEYYEANFELTKQIFDAFLGSKSEVFIFISTVKAVADEVVEVLTEDCIPNPITHYGLSKYKAEQYILSKNLPQGKRVYVLRPCMIHGIGNKGNLNLLYKIVDKNIPWPLGAFENRRSFLSVENLCFAIKELLKNKAIPSGVYNISDDQPLSTNELIEFLGISLGKKIIIWNIAPFLIKSIARIGDFLLLPLNSERLHKLTENYVVSNQKITSAIGKPLPYSSKESILKTFKSFKY